MELAAAAVVQFLDLAQKLPPGTFISVPAQIVFTVIDGYKLAKRNKKAAASLVEHTCELMVPLVRVASSHSYEELGVTLTEELKALPELLNEVQEGMLQITRRGIICKFVQRNDDKQLIEDIKAKLVERLRTFEVKGLLSIQTRQITNEQARQEDHAETVELVQKIFLEVHRHLDQLQVTTTVVTRARPSALRQAVSPHFTGRDDLVAAAITAITGSSRPHLSFFGTGGIGKTSMALAVARHESCIQHFGDYRYFVECEAVTSASAVRSSILQALAGSFLPPSLGDPRQLLAEMLSVDHMVLLILDNFETPWNTAGQRSELTELLKDMAAMPNVRLITTLRSDDAPASADVAWTALPVQVLDLGAARDLFLAINSSTPGQEHDHLDRLLKEVDCLPLAVKLLAQVKKRQTCSELLQRWQETKTSLVTTELQRGTRLTSLDVSIRLSTHSPLVDDAARKLLATICLLPAGVIGGRQKLKAMNLGVPGLYEKLAVLLEVALVVDDYAINRITIPPPIRAYVSSQAFLAYEEQLETHYMTQVTQWDELSRGDAGYVDKQGALLDEVDNIRYIFERRLTCHPTLELGRAIFAFTYLEFYLRPSTQLITCLASHLTRVGWEEHRPYCTKRLAEVHTMLSKYSEAEQELEAAQAQFVELGARLEAAQCLLSLAEVHTMLSKYAEAEQELEEARAQFVELGYRPGTAQCLRGLAEVHRMLSKYSEAEQELEAAHAQFVELGDRSGTAQCLRGLAEVHRMLDKYPEAEQELEAARAQYIELGSRLGAVHCLQTLAEVHRMLSKYPEAEQELEAARVQFVELGSRLEAAQCLRGLGEVHVMLSKYAEAKQELEVAQSQFVELGSRLGAAQCLQTLAQVHRMLFKHAEAEQELKAARSQFVELGDRLGTAQCLRGLAEVHMMVDMYAEAEQELEAAHAQFVELGDRQGAAQCLHCLGDVHGMLCKYAEAEQELQTARARFVEIGDRLGAAQCLGTLAQGHRMLSQYPEAEEELETSRAQFVEVGDRLGAAQCLQSLAEVHAMQGKYVEAEQELEAARLQFIEVGNGLKVAQCVGSLAEICRELQRWQAAETLLAQGESLVNSIGHRYGQAWVYRYRGRLYKAQERYDEARTQCARSRELFLSIGLMTHAEHVMDEAAHEVSFAYNLWASP